MHVSAISDLLDREREALLAAISAKGLYPAFADAEEMQRYLLGPVFEMGSTYLTLWDGETLCGAIGIVVREIPSKGEAFLTLLHVFVPDADAALAPLLSEAYAVLRRFGGADGRTVVKIGIGPSESRLRAPLERAGCRIAFRVLDMVRTVDDALPRGPVLRFQPLTAENLTDFLTVHNAAFLQSPNGGHLNLEELEGLRQEARSEQFLQVGYADAAPAAILELDVRGEVGQIMALGVAPAFQRRGMGRAALAHALQVLGEGGAAQVHLQVVELNTPAVELYRASGFQVDEVVATWYSGVTHCL